MPAVAQKIPAVSPGIRVAKDWKRLQQSRPRRTRGIPHDNPDSRRLLSDAGRRELKDDSDASRLDRGFSIF
jgi:hypothetical protein